MLSFPEEINNQIAFFCSPKDLYQLLLSNIYFRCIRLDWNLYFRYHSGYCGDYDINKDFMSNYGIHLIDKDNQYINEVIRNIKMYESEQSYQKLLKHNRPLFLSREDFNGNKYQEVFSNCINRIVFVEKKDFKNEGGSLSDIDILSIAAVVYMEQHRDDIAIILI